MRVRSPSTTLTLTMTVSPGSNGGMVLPAESFVICSCSSCLIRFMGVSVGCAGNAGRTSAGEITGRRSFYDKDRTLSPFRVGPFRARHIGRPEVRAALAGEPLGLALAPGRDLG